MHATNDHVSIQLAVSCVGTYNLPHKRHPPPQQEKQTKKISPNLRKIKEYLSSRGQKKSFSRNLGKN